MEYKIRTLAAEEFNREDLKAIFEENDSKVPLPHNSSIAVAEDEDGKLLGFFVLQPVYHAEPLWIHPDYRNSMLPRKLIEVIIKPLELIKDLRVYIFVEDNKVLKLAKRFGFNELPYKVLEREF